MDDTMLDPHPGNGLPEDAGAYAGGLLAILERIPPQWGRWISCDAGWYPLLVRTHEQLAEIVPEYELCQVKEKFGTLRYYVSIPDLRPGCCEAFEVEDPQPESGAAEVDAWWERWLEHRDSAQHKQRAARFEEEPGTRRHRELQQRVREIVKVAEEESSRTCETCGAPGKLRRKYWYKTLCDPCSEIRFGDQVPAWGEEYEIRPGS